jgi:hypothetical protein
LREHAARFASGAVAAHGAAQVDAGAEMLEAVIVAGEHVARFARRVDALGSAGHQSAYAQRAAEHVREPGVARDREFRPASRTALGSSPSRMAASTAAERQGGIVGVSTSQCASMSSPAFGQDSPCSRRAEVLDSYQAWLDRQALRRADARTAYRRWVTELVEHLVASAELDAFLADGGDADRRAHQPCRGGAFGDWERTDFLNKP